MTLKHLLIANRGEISIRIARSAAELNIRSHAIFSEDDEQSDHEHHAVQPSGAAVRAPAPSP